MRSSEAGVHSTLACLKEAGLEFDLKQFDHRLMAQKVTYLLQELGVKTGYEGTFSFYLRGTYSPTLTKDLFGFAASKKTMPTKLTQADVTRIGKLGGPRALRPHVLEVMAAYRFLRKSGHSQEEATATIRKTKPFVSPRDVAIGISRCKGIFPEITQADIDSLREEMVAWDAAATEDEL